MEEIVDRISRFIRLKNLKVAEFERLCDLGNGSVKTLSLNTRRSTFNKISEKFPELNIDWLRTGEGNMLKNIYEQSQEAGNESILQQAKGKDIRQSVDDKDSKSLVQAISEISEMRKALTKAMEENQQNTQRLLDIVERLIDK